MKQEELPPQTAKAMKRRFVKVVERSAHRVCTNAQALGFAKVGALGHWTTAIYFDQPCGQAPC